MAKIAVDLDRALARRAMTGGAGGTTTRWLARGEGWRVGDVICTSGPGDRPFGERHDDVGIAIVTAGSFEYRTVAGHDLMTPGSIMLLNSGQTFECGHEHGAGDRCLSFHFDPGQFADLAADAAGSSRTLPVRGGRPFFRPRRLPPLRELSADVARACAALTAGADLSWEEAALRIAARVVRIAAGLPAEGEVLTSAALARATRVVRRIERDSGDDLSIAGLAREARLSRYHFLRCFQRLTGLTPHQYVRRTRLREAARRLLSEDGRVADIAFGTGFGDLSNFNHAFRAEFGVSPRGFRRTPPGPGAADGRPLPPPPSSCAARNAARRRTESSPTS